MYFENEIPPPTPSQALRAREALPPRRREGDFLKGRYTFDFLSNLCYNKNEKYFENEIINFHIIKKIPPDRRKYYI